MKRPFVHVNVAMTLDGKIDSIARQGALISSPEDTASVDRLRAQADAVMVGGRTLLEGDPRLTVKSEALRQERLARGLPENPAKVAVVSQASMSPESRFVRVGPARRLVYTTSRTADEQIQRLAAAGVEVFILGQAQVDLLAALKSMTEVGIKRLMVEGGGTLIAGLLEQGAVDEITVYIAPVIFAGAVAPTLAGGKGFLPEAAVSLSLLRVEKLDDAGGLLVHYRVRR